MMKPRPIFPPFENGTTMLPPVRIELAHGEHITWHTDGWIRKVFPNGNIEEWVSVMMVEAPFMHQTVTPSGTLHTTYYTTDEATDATVGTFINYHMVDVNDVDVMHWDNECDCFEESDKYEEALVAAERDPAYEEYYELNRAHIYPSRCAAIGYHVGDGDCAVCAPELSDNENCEGRYVAEEEDYDY